MHCLFFVNRARPEDQELETGTHCSLLAEGRLAWPDILCRQHILLFTLDTRLHTISDTVLYSETALYPRLESSQITPS